MDRKRYAPGLLLISSVILLGLGARYYLARMTNLDMAFQTFLILKSGSLEIQSGRFGAIVTQIWAWTAQELGLSLKWVLRSYSMGHVFWPVLLAGLAWKWGQWRWAFVILLTATLLTTHTFFWLSEMPQGLVFICAVYAWMHTKGSVRQLVWWEWGGWMLALWTAFYFHPMVLYANLFIGLFFILEPGKNKDWRIMHLIPMGVFVLLAILKYKVMKLDWYDAAALKRQDAFAQLWPNWLDIESNHRFWEWCSRDYWLLILVLLAGIAWQIWHRKWARAWLVAGWSFGFILLVNVPFHSDMGKQFYMENLYLPLAVFASVPLMFEVLQKPVIHLSGFGLGILSLIFALSFARIIKAGEDWQLRMLWEKQVLHQTANLPSRKILMTEGQAPMDLLKMSWGSPYEWLLLSSLEHPDSARCLIITPEPAKYDTLMTRPDLFLGTFRNYSLDSLPVRYFNVKDRTKGYTRIPN